MILQNQDNDLKITIYNETIKLSIIAEANLIHNLQDELEVESSSEKESEYACQSKPIM